MKQQRTVKSSSSKYTQGMIDAINEYRESRLMTWEQFYKEFGISGRTTIKYWEEKKSISFFYLRKLKAKGLDLSLYIEKHDDQR